MSDRRDNPRMTHATMAVLRALLEEPTREMYGLEICAVAGLPTGTVHPILARLEGVGWLGSDWERLEPKELGRPRRRYYKLSEHGAMRASAAVQRAESQAAQLRARRPGLAGGAAT